jgi:hypothetical protein
VAKGATAPGIRIEMGHPYRERGHHISGEGPFLVNHVHHRVVAKLWCLHDDICPGPPQTYKSGTSRQHWKGREYLTHFHVCLGKLTAQNNLLAEQTRRLDQVALFIAEFSAYIDNFKPQQLAMFTRHGIGSPGHRVIWVTCSQRVTGSPGHQWTRCMTQF